MDRIELSVSQLAKLTGLETDKLLGRIQTEEGELKEGYENEIQTLFIERFKEVKKEHYNRGIRTKGEATEKAFKPLFEQFQIDPSDFGTVEEAFQELQSKLTQSSKGEPGKTGTELKLEDITKRDDVRTWFDTQVSALKTQLTEKDKSLSDLRTQFHSYQVGSTAKQRALQILKESKAVAATPEAVDVFFKANGVSNLKIEGDSITVLDADGQPLKDELHNPVSFADYVKSNWFAGFSEAPAGSSGSNFKPGQGGGQPGKVFVRDAAHKEQLLKEAKTGKERAAIHRAYAEQVAEKE